ncbi:uncharacterized protein [Littorina saxatilis]|uniref:uncharacterized protein isoform X2 n=1 Tax=Littorina saxatilis TaxID=31220 RepID=UPI0038B4A1AA
MAADTQRCYHSRIKSDLESNIRLLSKVQEDFKVTAEELDSQQRKVKAAKIVSAMVGSAAVGAIITALLVYLSGIVGDILRNEKLRGLESRWTDVKGSVSKDMKIPHQSKEAITVWAKVRLPPEKAKAVIAALEKSTSEASSTKRLKHLDSKVIVTLLESMLSLIAADFSVFEILVGALKEKDDPGEAVRLLAKEMNRYKKQLEKKLKEEIEKEKHSVRIMFKLAPDEPADLGDESTASTSSNQSKTRLSESLSTRIQKVSITPEENLLSSYSAARTTQTDRDPVQSVPPPVFCKESSWQISGSFNSSGGFLQKAKSDVIVNVPQNAVPRGMYVDVYKSVCADVEHIQRALKLQDTHFVASPLAEFWAGEGFRFHKPVQITLPHCLPKGVDPSEVIVYRATKNLNGKIVLQEVPNRQQQDSRANNLQTSRTKMHSPAVESSYGISDDNKLLINTDGFSGYVCVHCKRKNKSSPTLLFVGAGANKSKANILLQTASIHVHVWDERLDVRDFLEEIAPKRITDKHHMTLCRVVKDGNETMSLRIDIIGENASAWRHLLRSNGQPGFAKEQTFKLEAVLGCDNKNCSASRPVTVHWMLETTAPSRVGQWLQCVVDVVHVPSDSKTSLSLELEGPRGRTASTGSFELRRDVLMAMDLDQLKTLALGLGVGETTVTDIWRRYLRDVTRKTELVEYLMQKFESEADKGKGKTKRLNTKQSQRPQTSKTLRIANLSSPSASSDNSSFSDDEESDETME